METPVCTLCNLRKKPVGRDAGAAMANSLCDHECPGYHENPKPDHLWPSEREDQESGDPMKWATNFNGRHPVAGLDGEIAEETP